MRRLGWESTYPKKKGSIPDDNNQVLGVQTSRNEVVGTDKRMSVVQFLREKKLGSTSQSKEWGNEDYREKGLVNTIEEIPKKSCAILVKESMDETQMNTEVDVRGQGVMETHQTETPKFIFEFVHKMKEVGRYVGLDLAKEGEGPIDMTYDMDLGWVAEVLGPTSGHWKRKAREGQTKGKEKALSPVQKKKKKKCSNFTYRVRSEHARSEENESGGAGKC